MDKLNLLKEINAAFADVPYPHGEDFYKAIADRDYQEYVSLHRKKWSDITKGELLKYYDFIFFLKPNGVLYYLPAYMKLALENSEIADNQCTECLFMAIAELNPAVLNEWQQQAVKNFLSYCQVVLNPELDLDDDLLKKAIVHLAG